MKITDLTRTLKKEEGDFTTAPAKNIERDGWNAVTLCIYSHTGTHMDAPLHFNAGTEGIGEIAIENFVADCWIVNLPDIKPKSLIKPDDLGIIKTRVRPGEGVLFRTGWSGYYGNTEIFRNGLPRISEELALWCVEKKIRIIGVEPPSIADVNNIPEATRIHTLLLKAGITIVEGLVNLEQIKQDKVRFISLPLKIEKGDGSPCRAIAIED